MSNLERGRSSDFTDGRIEGILKWQQILKDGGYEGDSYVHAGCDYLRQILKILPQDYNYYMDLSPEKLPSDLSGLFLNEKVSIVLGPDGASSISAVAAPEGLSEEGVHLFVGHMGVRSFTVTYPMATDSKKMEEFAKNFEQTDMDYRFQLVTDLMVSFLQASKDPINSSSRR